MLRKYSFISTATSVPPLSSAWVQHSRQCGRPMELLSKLLERGNRFETRSDTRRWEGKVGSELDRSF